MAKRSMPRRGSRGALIRWEGDKELSKNMTRYEKAVLHAVQEVALYFVPVLETYAKQNAPWQDQTANARQSLHSFIAVKDGKTVRLFLSHGVVYGIHLETKYASKYAVIMPTIEAHLGQIRAKLQEIFS